MLKSLRLKGFLMAETPGNHEFYCDPSTDGEIPTPKALGDLLVSAVRERKAGEKPHIVYLSQEGAKEIQDAGIKVDKAIRAVVNITGVLVGTRRR